MKKNNKSECNFIFDRDSFIFDNELFSQYLCKIDEVIMPESQYEKYRIGLDIPHPSEPTDFFLFDSIHIQQDVYGLLIAGKAYDRNTVWLVNFSSVTNQYIDYRKIYDERFLEEKSTKMYSKIYLNDKKIRLYDNDTGLSEEAEIPMKIHKDGTFEEFPDTPFSEATIATSNCSGNGIAGKFPLKQQWTLINFDKKDITTLSTTRNYYDFIENESTLFPTQNDDPIFFDIAFQGVYSSKDIEFLSLKEENISGNEEIINIIDKNLVDEEGYFNEGNYDVTKLFSFIHNGKNFRLVHYTSKTEYSEYTSLFGITPENQVIILAYSCVYESHLFKFKNDLLLYTLRTSCGEGAVGDSYLYKIDNAFEKIYNEGIMCD